MVPDEKGAQSAELQPEIPRTSLVDAVARHLRRDLVIGAIQPGEPLRVAPLERRFGVSHIPIREALRHLEAEGLVVTIPQRGAVAAQVSLEEIGEIWDLRRLLEGQIAARSVESATPANHQAVREAVEVLRKTTQEDPQSHAFREAHTAFHWSLLEPGATGWIKDTLDRLWQGSERYIGLFASFFGLDVDEFMSEHDELVETFEGGDGNLMAQMLISHITDTERVVRSGYLDVRSDEETPTLADTPS